MPLMSLNQNTLIRKVFCPLNCYAQELVYRLEIAIQVIFEDNNLTVKNN